MKKQHGLSLIELMISITLGLLLISGVIQMFLSSKQVYSTQQGVSRVQETGRLAMEFVGRDVRMASYFGCVRTINEALKPKALSSVASSTASSVDYYAIKDDTAANPSAFGLSGLHQGFRVGLRGYNTTSSTGAAALPHGAATDLGSTFTVKTDSDVLMIHGANDRGTPINAQNDLTHVYGYTPEDNLTNNCVEGFCNTTGAGIAVISDCEKGRIFKINATPALNATTNTVTLTHSTWAVSSTAGLSDRDTYVRGLILPVHTITYFVASATSSTPSALWQKIDADPAQELLQGVEDLYITYSTGNGNYVTAANVADWDEVISLKMEVLVRGFDQRNTDRPQPYTFKGTTTTPTDNVYRQVFRSTFAVRTRMM